jgi:hypothetical protein
MAEKDLLKEAIADAKTVKEIAIANAMLTLKESFRPQLTSMLTKKLREEEESVDEDTVDEQKKLDSSGIGSGLTVDEPSPKQPSASASDSSDIENPSQETDTFGEGIEGLSGAEPEVGMAGMGAGQDDMSAGGDMSAGEDELDLEAIVRELEADLAAQSQGGDMATAGMGHGAPEGEHGMEMQPEGFNSVDAGLDVNAGVTNEETAVETTKSTQGFGNSANRIKREGDEGVFKDGKEIPAVDGVNKGTKVSGVTESSEVEETVDLDEIMREIAAEDTSVKSGRIATENAELKRSIKEHREVIKLLRTRINEVTLLNSKLMFTTKIFRNFNLSENQKKKIVEQFDRATTLREAKIIYTTLAESLHGRVVTQTPKAVKAITEGASGVVGSTKPKSSTVLSEGTTQVSRMQKLAGIKPQQ